MRQRLGMIFLLTAGALGLGAQPAAAQQTLNFSLGYFTVRGEDARVEGDIPNEHRGAEAALVFEISEFNAPTVGAEWLVPLGEYFEAGAGVAFSRRTVPSVYEDFVDADGSEIEQDLRLRLVPVAFTLRVLPLGQQSGVQPYFGAGLGLINWRYSESGEFIDFSQNNAIFREQFVASGSETGPVVLGGIRFAGDTISAGAEVRYHSATGDLGTGFGSTSADPKIDLGGWSYLFTIGMRFGS
jgi:outer membrane protein W